MLLRCTTKHFLFALLVITACSAVIGCTSDSTYQSCTTNANCQTPNQCWTINTGASTGSLCSRTCTAPTDCKRRNSRDPVCLSLAAGEDALCYEGCTANTDCAAGSECFNVPLGDGTSLQACFPVR